MFLFRAFIADLKGHAGLLLVIVPLVCLFLLCDAKPVESLGKCNCATSADCKNIFRYWDWICGWGWWCDPPKKHPTWDGKCYRRTFFLSAEVPSATQALDLWLLAYETAGATGGGPPDPLLVEAARQVPLDAKQHETIRLMAFQIQSLYLGVTEHPSIPPRAPGLFEHPSGPGDRINKALPPDQNGYVPALAPDLLAVAFLVREGVIGEMLNPDQGVLDAQMSQLPILFPTYAPLGMCEYPPPMGPENFPYADGLECLTEELRELAHSVLPKMKGDK
ncbi:hypothetical protein ACFLU6_11225 [Acidobacteriota bacterium]